MRWRRGLPVLNRTRRRSNAPLKWSRACQEMRHAQKRCAHGSIPVPSLIASNAVTTEFLLLFAIGFFAQLVDGALGMAFGLLSNTAMLMMGLPPAQASAIVHTAEVFTTGASAASHIYHRNVDWRLVRRLAITGVLGAVLGAWILSNLDLGTARRYVYVYLLLMGIYILLKAVRVAAERQSPAGWTAPIGFIAGFLDASGGGGWGPVLTTTLIGS